MEEKKSNTLTVFKKNTKKTILIVGCLGILIGLCVYFNVIEHPTEDIPLNVPTEEDQPIDFENSIFGKDISAEEAQMLVFEKYSNNNLRIVGAVVQEVNNDYIIIKTYRAGENNSSIVEEKRINIIKDTPVFETIISSEHSSDAGEERITTKKTVSSLEKGDFVVIECKENKNTKESEILNAVMFIKDVVVEEPDDMLPVLEKE